MNTAQLLRLAPTLILATFLAYSSYSMQASLPGAAEERAELSKGLDTMVDDILVRQRRNRANGWAVRAFRDPFQVRTQGGSQPHVPRPCAARSRTDPLAEIVKRPDARCHRAPRPRPDRDHRRPDLFPRAAPAHRRRDSGKSRSSLWVANVLPAKVILHGDGKDYVLGYPDQLGRKPDSGNEAASRLAKEQAMGEIDPGGQLALFQKLLNSPQDAMGGGLIGWALTDPSSGRGHVDTVGSAPPRAASSVRQPLDTRSLTVHQHRASTVINRRPLSNSHQPKTDRRSLMGSVYEDIGTHPLILELLARHNRFGPKEIEEIEETLHKARGNTLPEVTLIRGGYISEQEITSLYAEDLFLPVIRNNLEAGVVDKEIGGLLPEKLCTDRLICPMAVRDDVLDVAFVSAEEMGLVDELHLMTGLRINPIIAPLSVVQTHLDTLYRSDQHTKGIGEGSEGFDATEEDPDDDNENILNLDASPPADSNGRIIRMVNQILEQALRNGASDIHLEPFEDGCKFRLRIDGILHELPSPSKAIFIMIISRFKILARMDIAEKRIPQDGAIALRTGDKRIDLRVNTVPTVHGEKMVMRILDKGTIPLNLTGLGLDERQSTDLIEAIHSPYGLALVTGPTGSGKSTTLYSCLNQLNESKVNICTVEDPVEYKFKGMNQVQVKVPVGLTFASALRAFLRQDPDIIMVGEVRDQETAEICLRAALTGHLVLSTIHTNDALSAVTRLQDMGIEPFLLSCSLRVLEAQRLVRRLCSHCKEPYEVTEDLTGAHGLTPGETIYRPKGCLQCRRLGYRGRVGVFEVIKITPRLTQLIQKRAPLDQLRKAAREEGMKTLFDSALEKVRVGITSLEAALSVTMAEEE